MTDKKLSSVDATAAGVAHEGAVKLENTGRDQAEKQKGDSRRGTGNLSDGPASARKAVNDTYFGKHSNRES